MRASAGIDLRLENPPQSCGYFFACRDFAGEFRDIMIQMPMIETRHHFTLQSLFELVQIEDHSRFRIRLAGNSDFENVVVPVTMWIIAFAKNPAVVLRGEFRIVIEVRRGEFEFSRQFNHVRHSVFNGASSCRAIFPALP